MLQGVEVGDATTAHDPVLTDANKNTLLSTQATTAFCRHIFRVLGQVLKTQSIVKGNIIK